MAEKATQYIDNKGGKTVDLINAPWYEFLFKSEDIIKGVPHRLIERFSNALMVLPNQYLKLLLIAYTDSDWNSHYLMTNNPEVLGIDAIAAEFDPWLVNKSSKIVDIQYHLVVGDQRLFGKLRGAIQQ